MSITGQQSNETVGQYTLATGTAPASQCGAPSWTFSGTLNSTGGNITLAITTAGSSIFYSLDGGATTAYTAPVFLGKNHVIEFWATAAGLLDSTHITVDNTV